MPISILQFRIIMIFSITKAYSNFNWIKASLELLDSFNHSRNYISITKCHATIMNYEMIAKFVIRRQLILKGSFGDKNLKALDSRF